MTGHLIALGSDTCTAYRRDLSCSGFVVDIMGSAERTIDVSAIDYVTGSPATNGQPQIDSMGEELVVFVNVIVFMMFSTLEAITIALTAVSGFLAAVVSAIAIGDAFKKPH